MAAIKLKRMRPRRRVTFGTLFGVLTIGLYTSYHAGFYKGNAGENQKSSQIATLNEAETQLQAQNKNLQDKLAVIERNYLIQQEAKKHLENYLKVLQQQNTDLMRDMALYQNVSDILPKEQALQIKTFQIFAMNQAHQFRYLLLLSKQIASEQASEGIVTLMIRGRIGEKPSQLSVKYVDSTRTDGLAFKLRHFQELTGELSLPATFVPEVIVLTVKPDGEVPLLKNFLGPWPLTPQGKVSYKAFNDFINRFSR